MPVYRLCGFSGILGLRPTVFQEPLHTTRICGLCGVVPEKTSLLPCGHALCQLCFDGMVSKGSVCPLDEKEFVGQEIPRLEFTREQIEKFQVHCWNAESGCDFVGPVTSLLDHYNQECVCHIVPCPRCRRPVLRRHLAEHWAAGCDNFIAEQREAQEPRWISDVTEALEKLSSDNAILQTTFNELLEGIRSENSSIRQTVSSEALRLGEWFAEKAACISEKQDQLQKMIGDMKVSTEDPLNNESNGLSAGNTTSLGKVDSITRPIISNHSLHWCLDKWSKLKDDALLGRCVDVRSAPTYVLKYRVLLRAGLRKVKNTLNFSLYLRVTKGVWDQTLEWPFRKSYTLSIIHLEDPSRTISDTRDLRTKSEDYWIPMPGTSDTTGCVWPLVLNSVEIESRGLVTSDTIHLSLEIHS